MNVMSIPTLGSLMDFSLLSRRTLWQLRELCMYYWECVVVNVLWKEYDGMRRRNGGCIMRR